MNPPNQSPEESVPVEEMSYEQALSELEAIVQELETDEHTLEESLAMFERGQVLIRYCSHLLEQAELKVQEISGDELVDFDPS